MLVSPGDLYGPDGGDHVRIALVQPDDRIELAATRIAESGDLLSGGGRS
jgi:aspartate/methionine/tyrosine aminotransferase